MQENWVVVNQKGNFEKLKSEISLSPLITRLLSNRNITTKKDAYMFLNGTIDDLYDSRLMKDMVRGVTGIYSKGCYKNEDNTMLMCIVRNKELPRLLQMVKEIDDSAFTIISDVMEVRGEGFKELNN